jgi:hypothetical protein
MLMRGSMLEVSRDAAAAGEEQLVSCATKQIKFCSIFTVTLDPCGDLPFTSWGRADPCGRSFAVLSTKG